MLQEGVLQEKVSLGGGAPGGGAPGEGCSRRGCFWERGTPEGVLRGKVLQEGCF